MTFRFRRMSDAEANTIAAWHYDGPYAFYDWTADADDLAELLSPERRGDRYFSALGEDGELLGFLGLRREEDDIVIGLGLRPDLTGRGLGLGYLEAGMAFAHSRSAPSQFRLSVAAFNQRAIRVYERAGFETIRTYDHETNGGIHPFIEMVRDAAAQSP